MTSETRHITVYVTAPTAEEAKTIARALVFEGLAACVNVLGPILSIYRWDGKMVEDHEVALLAKTDAAHFDALSARVLELHSYDCPCIVSWPISKGAPAYLAWLDASLSRSTSS